MGAISDQTGRETERDAQRMQANRAELVERLGDILREDGVIQPVSGVHLGRLSGPTRKIHSVMEPSFCVIAQGSKEVLLHTHRYQYDPANYLLAALELPRVSQVLDASRERPYLSFRLVLDPPTVSSVMLEAAQQLPPPGPIESRTMAVRAVAVSPLDVNLLDAVVRLVRLLETPAGAPILMPMIVREIIYRLLTGDQGARLRHLAVPWGYSPAIARAVQRIRQDFDQPLRTEQLARALGMSVSGFHYHFKAVTAMSPLQYQKQIRLQEARRLMLSENLDATGAAYRVGYHDPSHFNREYKSLFGFPPMRDVQRLRETSDAPPSP